MTNSYIGLKKVSLDSLRRAGIPVPAGVTAVRVEIDDKGEVSGSQWTVKRAMSRGAMRNEFVEAPLDAALKAKIKSHVGSAAFKGEYKSEFGIEPGQAFVPKTAKELLEEARSCHDWADIEAEMVLHGKALSKLLAKCGVPLFKPADAAAAPVPHEHSEPQPLKSKKIKK